MNEKGAVAQVEKLRLRPDRFAATVTGILARPGDTSETLAESIGQMEAIVAAVEQLCARIQDG